MANLFTHLLKTCLLTVSELFLSQAGYKKISGLPQLICGLLAIFSGRFVLFSHMTTALTGKWIWLHFFKELPDKQFLCKIIVKILPVNPEGTLLSNATNQRCIAFQTVKIEEYLYRTGISAPTVQYID
jgi:hypothetical protein